MSEETKTELKLPRNYKRPSLAEFTGPGHNYPAERYEGFFQRHEAELSEAMTSGALTDEMFDEDLRKLGKLDADGNLIDDEMVDADGDGLPDILHVRSMVRAQATRTARARQPTRQRFKQYLFGNPALRLMRKRVLRITATMARTNLDELIAKEAGGLLAVYTPNGARIDLAALKRGEVVLAQLPAPAPLPNPPLDSANNDIPAGQNMPQYVDGTFVGDPAAERVAQEMSDEKRREAEKKEPTRELSPADGEDPADPAKDPAESDVQPDAGVSTELQQPALGVGGTTAPIVDQLPKDSEASVEAPVVDPLAATEVLSRGDVGAGTDLSEITAPDGDVLRVTEESAAEEPASEETTKDESSKSSKKHKKGSSK